MAAHVTKPPLKGELAAPQARAEGSGGRSGGRPFPSATHAGGLQAAPTSNGDPEIVRCGVSAARLHGGVKTPPYGGRKGAIIPQSARPWVAAHVTKAPLLGELAAPQARAEGFGGRSGRRPFPAATHAGGLQAAPTSNGNPEIVRCGVSAARLHGGVKTPPYEGRTSR
ncbi:MAG: hypothetical protein DBX91_08740 [Subdoligranulum variabile]|nr:MAG: hypothetical protein DBX91_08740 [Subdoligranulum variabile]